MPAEVVTPLRDLQDAKQAFDRVLAQIDAQDPAKLSAMNVDVMSAVSVAIECAPDILLFRDRAADLPDFDLRNFDCLVDYAKATWYLLVAKFPAETVPREDEAEVLELRDKLMLWAHPLAMSGFFSRESMAKIRARSGIKSASSSLLALVALFRSQWGQVETKCGVKEKELERAAKVGEAVLASIRRQENGEASPPARKLRVQKAWTLLDRAYTECRCALEFLRRNEGGADEIAPSLRWNKGPGRSARSAENPPATPAPAAPSTPVTPAAPRQRQRRGENGR